MLSKIVYLVVLMVTSVRSFDNSSQNVWDRTNTFPKDSEAGFWYDRAQLDLNAKIALPPSKDIGSDIGSGMSIATLTATRTYLEQSGQAVPQLSFENFPYSGLSKTYCVDKHVADAACAATALLTGVKTNTGTVGVSSAVKLSDCSASQNVKNQLTSVLRLSQLSRKRTGIVTTSRVTDATTAAAYAYTANRLWENDFNVASAGYKPEICNDIADQLVTGESGRNLNVILGGGRTQFLPIWKKDEQGHRGLRTDGRNLIKEWQRQNGDRRYISNRTQLLALTKQDFNVLGLFGASYLPYNLDRDGETVPSLAEMTRAAVKSLSLPRKGEKNEGFFLLVEGSRIAHAHSTNKARKALDETIELDKAVRAAVEMTKLKETLIIVTATHGETMSFNGDAKREDDVFGIAGKAADGLPYTILTYATGPGYRKGRIGRPDLSQDDMSSKDYKYPALAPKGFGTHGGEDVSVHAQGPWAQLITGVHEQNYLAHVIAYASCAGNGSTVCRPGPKQTPIVIV